MNATQLFWEAALGLVIGAATVGVVIILQRRNNMSQKTELDSALAGFRKEFGDTVGPALTVINGRLEALTTKLDAKNEASTDTDLTQEIADAKDLSSLLGPIKDLADNIAATSSSEGDASGAATPEASSNEAAPSETSSTGEASTEPPIAGETPAPEADPQNGV